MATDWRDANVAARFWDYEGELTSLENMACIASNQASLERVGTDARWDRLVLSTDGYIARLSMAGPHASRLMELENKY